MRDWDHGWRGRDRVKGLSSHLIHVRTSTTSFGVAGMPVTQPVFGIQAQALYVLNLSCKPRPYF